MEKIYVLLVNVTLMKMLSKNKAVWCYFMDLGKTEKSKNEVEGMSAA